MSSNAQESLERYLGNQPLNDELAAMRRGEMPAEAPRATLSDLITSWWGPVEPPAEEDDKPLSTAERQLLAEAQQMGVVTTFIKLLKKGLREKIRRATIDSEHDPLGRQAEIAQMWAYIGAYRTTGLEFEAAIRMEIEALQKGTSQ